ncbi:hypothetical protein [Bradyrhizobium sp. C9]|uniref:hypothetical protein n=1 Tax=Bradyrhizobium sp. C9 TaxID=142585 RepID=UPI000BEA6969|nr:hypothetical protein [Bradyrhizobium sp. C9]PDT74091.1 hypothetical protein CO675_26835 [Bradyrhizobium sp. C9]
MSSDLKTTSDSILSDGLTLEGGIEFLRRYKYRLAIPLLAGAALAVSIAFFLPKQWEAHAVLQMGQVFSKLGNGQSQIALVESGAIAVERIRQEQFQDAVLRRLNLPVEPNVNRETDLVRASANPRVVRNTEFVDVAVRGTSPEQARKAAEAYQLELIKEHAEMAQPSLARIAENKAQFSQEIQNAELRRQSLQKLVIERDKSPLQDQFSEMVVLNQLIQQNDVDLRSYRQTLLSLEEEGSPERTFNTRPLFDVVVGRRPVSPGKTNFLIVGATIGFVLGLFGAYLAERKRGTN